MILGTQKKWSMNKPTVTQLIDLLNKPALLKWANKIGLDGVSLANYRTEAKTSGTSVHKRIENDLLHGIKFDDPAFQLFKSNYEVLKVEPEIECEHYKGRVDILLKRNNLTWLFDFKAADRIYFEQALQLIAYNRVLKADRIGIVHTKTFIETIVSVTPDQVKLYEKIIGGLYNIWKAKQELGE